MVRVRKRSVVYRLSSGGTTVKVEMEIRARYAHHELVGLHDDFSLNAADRWLVRRFNRGMSVHPPLVRWYDGRPPHRFNRLVTVQPPFVQLGYGRPPRRFNRWVTVHPPFVGFILLAVQADTNPKRKRGLQLLSSLTLRVGVDCFIRGRERDTLRH